MSFHVFVYMLFAINSIALPFVGVWISWKLFGRLSKLLSLFGGWLLGTLLAFIMPWQIYLAETGGGDPDPLRFLIIATASGSIASLFFAFLFYRANPK